MENPQVSPLSQLLNTLGITKEDLNRRSDQMRQFLTSDSAFSSRVASQLLSSSESRPLSRSNSISTSFTRHVSRGSSVSARDASPTPSSTPVKPEPEEDHLPPRQLDHMEMVLERQRINRKQKRKKREQEYATETPSDPLSSSGAIPSGATNPRDETDGVSGASHSADSAFSTPTRSKHYREHTSYSASDAPSIKREVESPSLARNASHTAAYPYHYHSAYASQSQFLSLPFRSLPLAKTPVKASRILHPSSPSPKTSPLPPSSPPVSSSPISSPVHGPINTVSSPGPVGELAEEEYEEPPYKLPPGPYSSMRPHYSYAGIIGQAILSSRDHRLTLQEIYEWITTVYPHFKRGERTWMNSIRHVLSTTVHFRKITRERSAGRSHWAILDEDLHCFVDGGYRKPGSLAKRVGGAVRPVKPRKRAVEEVDEEEDTSPSALAKKSAKRFKKTTSPPLPANPFPSAIPSTSSQQPPGLLPDLVHPQEKPRTARPTTNRQTYYESCVPPPTLVPSDIIFPRLPNSSHRVVALNVSAFDAAEDDNGEDLHPESEDEVSGVLEPSSPGISTSTPEVDARSSSPTSIPALTPNASSSSPIPASEMDEQPNPLQKTSKQKRLEDLAHFDVSVTVSSLDGTEYLAEQDGEEAGRSSLLRPVQFWDDVSSSASDAKTLQPGIELQKSSEDSEDDEEEVPLILSAKKSEKKALVKVRPAGKMPSSPSLHRRKTAAATRSSHKSGGRKRTKSAQTVLAAAPSTPPRAKSSHNFFLSPTQTPLSQKGPNKSPSHSKSSLDRPALLFGSSVHVSTSRSHAEDDDDEPRDPMRTPSRKRNVSSSSTLPVTPRRLLFPSDSSSPFRTPGGNTLSASPFRTPLGGRGSIFDPHDPSTLLDEELSSLGAVGRDSPAGIYAKGALYSSPNPVDGSPGKWARWW